MNTTGGHTAGGWLGGVLGMTVVTTGLLAGRGTIWQMTGMGGTPPGETVGGETNTDFCGWDTGAGWGLQMTVCEGGTEKSQSGAGAFSLASASVGVLGSHADLLGDTVAHGTFLLEASAGRWGLLRKELSWQWRVPAAFTGQDRWLQSWASAVWRITLVA